ncbi:MAG TPA: hypothetical protein VK188_19500 [Holophaga sp.]|nr:hypothetical protein [Holophaga sp.]
MRKLLVPAVLTLMPLLAAPASAQEVPITKFVAIAAETFSVNGLDIVIQDLTRNQIMGTTPRLPGRANITLRLRNPGKAFASFAPQDLALVGKSGLQTVPLCELNSGVESEALLHQIAPGAYIEVRYILSGKVQLPAKLYLGGKLVAEIQE